ncbi:amidohydrolase [Traorella massiliensis]|uniref:amidohydrolase n=1 Tax=Traorella massiliensis TaxID=1903263 RepID=UPI00248EAC55|nr:amidohydrolase [Traorella massiliensis]
MKIRKEIQMQYDTLLRIRRELHQIPETGFDTYKTMAYITQQIPIMVSEYDGFSGVFYLQGQNKKCLGFRCELDGLPIREKNSFTYASFNGNMHACGHDAHMAIMICTLLYFIQYPPKYSLLFIFQPAEESGGGANYMIQKGIFEKYGIEYLLAVHVFPHLKDKIGCCKGVLMARSCEIKVIVRGKSVHAAHSEQGIDVIKILYQFLNWVDELKENIRSDLIHFGRMNCGEVCNAVAAYGVLEGTMRCFDDINYDMIRTQMIRQLSIIDEEYHSTSEIIFSEGYEKVVNDEKLNEYVLQIAKEDYVEMKPLYLSEDFSFYRKKCPCCLYLCGLSSEEDLHSSSFDLKEEECLKAVEMNVSLAERIFCEMM